QLYIWRTWIVAVYGMKEHVQLFLRLKPVHMSGDEAENDEDRLSSVYTIIEAAWQSTALKTFLRQLDAMYVAAWPKRVGDRGRGGKGPRRRKVKANGKGRVVDSVAPVGLWRNCYDDEWVKQQDPWVIRELCIVNDDYDFTIHAARGTVSAEEANGIQETILVAAGVNTGQLGGEE
ncbi:hypothetical protein LXA43DRAFT_904207, partial [Ganoderma leucocontextum]